MIISFVEDQSACTGLRFTKSDRAQLGATISKGTRFFLCPLLAHLGSLLLIDSTTKGRMRFERSIEPGAMAEREDDQSPRTQALALSNTSMRRTSWSID